MIDSAMTASEKAALVKLAQCLLLKSPDEQKTWCAENDFDQNQIGSVTRAVSKLISAQHAADVGRQINLMPMQKIGISLKIPVLLYQLVKQAILQERYANNLTHFFVEAAKTELVRSRFITKAKLAKTLGR